MDKILKMNNRKVYMNNVKNKTLREDNLSLQHTVNGDMLNMSYIQEQIEMIRRKEVLKKYGGCIWFSKGEQVWYCHLPDDTKPAGRKKVKRKNKTDIENVVYDFYASQLYEDKKKRMTFSQLFFEYMEHKKKQVKTGTINRMLADWKKFYADKTDFINKDFSEITKIDVDDFLNSIVDSYKPKDKNFRNICGIIKQTFEYAVDSEYLEKSPYRTSKVNKKNIIPTRKQSSEQEIFYTDEQILLEQEMLHQIKKDETYLVPWIILLDFEIGTRIGEILAINESDICEDRIHIHRQLVQEYDVTDLDKVKSIGWHIVEYTKSDCGDRWIPLTKKARWYIENVMRINNSLQRSYKGYLFFTPENVINDNAVKANLKRSCKRIGIPERGTHKIRKTFASRLYDADVALSDISKLLGHADETTTIKHYIYSMDNADILYKKVISALDKNMDIEKVTKSDQKIVTFPTSQAREKAHKYKEN